MIESGDSEREAREAGDTDRSSSEPGDLARIRALLLGSAPAEWEERIAALERARIAGEERLRREVDGRIAAFRGELERGLERLGAALVRERDARLADVRALRADVAEAAASNAALADRLVSEAATREAGERDAAERLDATGLVLAQRIEAGDVSLARKLEEARSALAAELAGESEALRRRIAKFGAEWSAALATCRSVMVERSALARELSDLAAKLGGERTPPPADARPLE